MNVSCRGSCGLLRALQPLKGCTHPTVLSHPQQRRYSMTKRGPLDRYFTQLPATKKVKPNSAKDEQQVGVAATTGLRPVDGNSADAPQQQQQGLQQSQPNSPDATGAATAAQQEPQQQGSKPPAATSATPAATTTSAAAGAAAATTAANGDSSVKVAGSVKAAPAPAAAGGALTALMSAAKGQAAGKNAAAKAGSQEQRLTLQQMQVLADRNQTAAQAVVDAAAAAKQQPQLKDLLVEPSWRDVLGAEFDKPYMQQLQTFLNKEWASGTIYPPKKCVFRAFNAVPFDQVRVVILGQDPYINPGEAMGLSFSVPPGVRVPPSLQNMYKELAADLDCKVPNHGCLEKWCRQGVLLLNAALTVRAKASNSHAGKGWEGFTSAALSALVKQRSGIVFLLWGKFAQDRCAKLDMKKHHVLKSMHPSPLSAHRGYFGCKHFSATNRLLVQSGLPEIDWQIENV
eukprot:GHUV01012114.1.p1 GENE.GHUV01012114.1~~GHUV01012114.1.p1  ORF type:complete len:457 (+),score=171.53 GHUV01012114.1:132-1502(+)